MKKQLAVHIHSMGRDNTEILTMIGNSNSGKTPINILVIASYLDARRAIYPSLYKEIGYNLDEENNQLDIWEGEKDNFTLHIEEHTVFEMEDQMFDFGNTVNPIFDQYENKQ